MNIEQTGLKKNRKILDIQVIMQTKNIKVQNSTGQTGNWTKKAIEYLALGNWKNWKNNVAIKITEACHVFSHQ